MTYRGLFAGKLKVRFHLAKGANFMKWQIKEQDGTIHFVDPENYRLVMENCSLTNQKGTAKKIFEGENKSVCSWINCNKVLVYNDQGIGGEEKILSYNPKITPNWVYQGENVDGEFFGAIYTGKRKLYAYSRNLA
tara:strand:+ start:11324 stop:11728 length:405 start_codon:yes stop_codon:yes gene_type:complete